MSAVATDPYPTRLTAPADLSPRIEPVLHPPSDGQPRTGPLTDEQLAAFERDGLLVVPELIPAQARDRIDAEVDRLAADPEVRARSEAILEPDSEVLRSLFAVHNIDGPLAELAGADALAGAARQILGSDVYMHQSRVNLKPGFRGREFYWHSDFETWHAEDGMPRMRAVSCSVSLTPNHPWNGPLLGIAGSHRWFVPCLGETPENHYEQSLRKQEYGTPSDAHLTELAEMGEVRQCTGPAGTVTFFDCNLMHGSNSNISPAPRRNVFLVYNSVDNALVEPFAAPDRRPEFIASRDFTPV